MATVLHISFTGESEAFLQKMAVDIPFEDVIGLALWLLKAAHETRCVGLLRPDWMESTGSDRMVEQVIVAIDPAALQKDLPIKPPVVPRRAIKLPEGE